ncbi:MAG TPA: class I SAM-dependent methyltransferase [Rhodocyclaceae bacterium]
MKDFYNKAYQIDHPHQYGGGERGMPERTALLTERTAEWLKSVGLMNRRDAKILEIGCGMAYLSKIHPGWNGAEYSATAVDLVRQRDGQDIPISEQDAQCLQYDDETFDAVYSWAALEHVPDPDKAFNEIDRVLRIGGFGLVAPAWNCRSWTVKKLEQRPVSELSLLERLERGSIPLREHLAYRALAALPARLRGELALLLGGGAPMRLRYRPLHPRWDLIEQYGHESDDDAVADIDLHAGICFFRSRGYDIISHGGFVKRFTARHEPLVVRKVRRTEPAG